MRRIVTLCLFMSRFICALLASFGLVAPVLGQQADAWRAPTASGAVGASAIPAHRQTRAATLAAVPVAPEMVPPAQLAASAADVALAASGGADGDAHRIRDLLTKKFGLARAKAEEISSAVMSSASKYSLPPALVLAIISIESRFQAHARGAHGATGLMQVVPAAHKRLVKNVDLTEPAANIEAGSAILHGYIESARGDMNAALRSYGGSTAYARKVSLRTKDFQAADAADAAAASSSP
jgi:soluble lytic murein transglycosylase-like protein